MRTSFGKRGKSHGNQTNKNQKKVFEEFQKDTSFDPISEMKLLVESNY